MNLDATVHSITAYALAFLAGVATAACGDVVHNDTPDGGREDAPVAKPSLKLAGCSASAGERPTSTSKPEAPSLAKLAINTSAAGQPLSGSVQFSDAQSDVTSWIIQVQGASEYLTCAASATDLGAKKIDLAQVSASANSGPGSFVVYIAAQDAQGNVSGYSVGTVVLGAPTAIAICDPVTPLQVIGRAVSATGATFASANGTTADYLYNSTPPVQLTIMRQTRLYLDVGACRHLYLAADAAGKKTPGWDNLLLVETRGEPGGAVTAAWWYSGESQIVAAYSTPKLVRAETPNIAGNSLDPPVPSTDPFGYIAKALDLKTQLPADDKTLEIAFYALDAGGDASTTDVWLLPEL